MKALQKEDFTKINFWVWFHNIDGGFLKGGTTVVINLQNNNKLFIDKGNDRRQWWISDFDQGLSLANEKLGIKQEAKT